MNAITTSEKTFIQVLTSKINRQFLIWDAKSRWTIMKRNIGWENVISLFAHSNEKYGHFRDITLNCLVHCYLRGVVMVHCTKLVFFPTILKRKMILIKVPTLGLLLTSLTWLECLFLLLIQEEYSGNWDSFRI